MIQIQKWTGKTRYLIVQETELGAGSIQLELYDEPQEFGGQWGTAFLWGLWVDRPLRRNGMAKVLMNLAEMIAADNGHDAIFLEWSSRETPIEIFHWYERLGYEEKEVCADDNASVLMRKQLNPKKKI